MKKMKKGFEYVEPKIRALVKDRSWKSRGRKSGAEIRLPKDWMGKYVRASLENNPNAKPFSKLPVMGKYYAYVSMPVEWIGKKVIAELL